VQQEYVTRKANDLIAQYIGTDTLQKFKTAVKERGNPDDVAMHATTTAGLPESPASTPKTTLPWWALALGLVILSGGAWWTYKRRS
jgi:LPXTG-motif cell wall-anchored protein